MDPNLNLVVVVGAKCLGYEGVKRQQEPHAEDRYAKEVEVAERYCREFDRVDPSHHGSVHQPLGHQSHLNNGNGKGQLDEIPQFLPCGAKGGQRHAVNCGQGA